MPTCHSWKMGLECWKWRPYKVRSLVSSSIFTKKNRNGPPSANQVASRDKPRRGHAVCTLWVHPSISPIPLFLLKQNLSPKGIAGSDIMRLKVSWWIYPLWVLNSFKHTENPDIVSSVYNLLFMPLQVANSFSITMLFPFLPFMVQFLLPELKEDTQSIGRQE